MYVMYVAVLDFNKVWLLLLQYNINQVGKVR